MSDPIYEILDNLRKEVQSLRVENDRLRRSRNDEIAAAGDLRKEIERLRVRVEMLETALKPFAAISVWSDDPSEWPGEEDDDGESTDFCNRVVSRRYIRAARAALEDKL